MSLVSLLLGELNTLPPETNSDDDTLIETYTFCSNCMFKSLHMELALKYFNIKTKKTGEAMDS